MCVVHIYVDFPHRIIGNVYLEILIHLECSWLTFLNTVYVMVKPTPAGSEYTHELSQELVLGWPRLDCMGTFDCHLFQ